MQAFTLPFADVNEELLRQILTQFFNTSFNAILITSSESGYPIVYANPEFCRMTGYNQEELIGKSPKIFQGERTNPNILARLKFTIEAGHSFHGAATNYRKNGDQYPVEWNISPIFESEGKIRFFISIQKDLSALKSVVSRLRSTNEHFRAFLSDISCSSKREQAAELEELITSTKLHITDELVSNSKIYAPELRSENSVELFDNEEFFDCSNELNGMLYESQACLDIISAEDYVNQHSSYDVQQLHSAILETQEKIDLLAYSKDTAPDMMVIGQNIHDIANDIFYFEDFVGISSVLGELATQTKTNAHRDTNPLIVESYRALMNDLETWIRVIFVEKTANDIHSLDASIISSAKQLLIFLK